MNNIDYDKIRKSSRNAAIITAIGAFIVLSSLIYSYFQLSRLTDEIDKKKEEVKLLSNQQNNLLDFLAQVTDDKRISILDKDVDWAALKKSLEGLKPGMRKQAILTAILLAWKDIPFGLNKASVSTGFDSPRFLKYVLEKNGLKIDARPNEKLSNVIMHQYKPVKKPQPGDLVFYEGEIGSFGFIYLADGQDGNGIGIGTLQAIDPLQIINLKNINTPDYPLIGYFHVTYPDEK